MTRLSVNINKIATLRNARGGNVPDVVKSAIDCERFGAQGITVHPRPDERHIRYQDVLDLKPEQVTLVPDPPGVLTSNAGWDTIKNEAFLTEVIAEFRRSGVRVSVFIETDAGMIENAAKTGADRVELYTESFAHDFPAGKEKAIKPFVDAALVANKVGLGLNAGHDLSLENLRYFAEQIPGLLEVSIGHALISDALYLGLENTIQMYLRQLGEGY